MNNLNIRALNNRGVTRSSATVNLGDALIHLALELNACHAHGYGSALGTGVYLMGNACDLWHLTWFSLASAMLPSIATARDRRTIVIH